MNESAINSFNKGLDYKSSKNLFKAITEFNNALNEGYDPKHIYFLLGLTYVDLLDDKKALLNFYKVVEISPNSIGPRMLIYDLFMKQGEFQEALIILDEILSINPKYFLAYNYKFNILKSFGLIDDCYKLLNSVESNLGKIDYYYLWTGSTLMLEKKFDDALLIFDKGAVTSVISDLFILEKAKLLAITNNYPRALSILNKLNTKNPNNVELLYYIGFLEFTLENYSIAKDHLAKLCDISVVNSNFYLIGAYYYGATLHKLNDPSWKNYMENLLTKYNRLSLSNKNNLIISFLIVLINMELQNLDTALDIVDFISANFGDPREIHYIKALIHHLNGLTEEANKEVELFKGDLCI